MTGFKRVPPYKIFFKRFNVEFRLYPVRVIMNGLIKIFYEKEATYVNEE